MPRTNSICCSQLPDAARALLPLLRHRSAEWCENKTFPKTTGGKPLEGPLNETQVLVTRRQEVCHHSRRSLQYESSRITRCRHMMKRRCELGKPLQTLDFARFCTTLATAPGTIPKLAHLLGWCAGIGHRISNSSCGGFCSATRTIQGERQRNEFS